MADRPTKITFAEMREHDVRGIPVCLLRRLSLLALGRDQRRRMGLALLGRKDNSWVPLALGDLTFETIVSADAWLTVPGNSEGFAAETPVAAYILETYGY